MKFLAIAALAATTSAVRVESTDDMPQTAQEIIDFLDTDNSGTVSLDELLEGVRAVHTEYCNNNPDDKKVCSKKFVKQAKKFLKKLFKDTDADGNGEVTKEEIENYVASH